MALISVLAWPIPIHQTKLVIANAQATGMLFPQVPMPTATVMVTAVRRRPVPARPSSVRASQPRCGRCQM